ncbi:MAG TPA: hypothetical protein VKS20_12350 [Candidatus Acidoferrales bacterium]|nr:hypothetical protein [Candidatus Acidoferrales bacterium]
MAKGRRASLDRLLRSAWERQTTLRNKSTSDMSKSGRVDRTAVWALVGLIVTAISLIFGHGKMSVLFACAVLWASSCWLGIHLARIKTQSKLAVAAIILVSSFISGGLGWYEWPRTSTGPNVRAYLESVPLKVWVDKHDDVHAEVETENVGALQVLPGASILGFIKVRKLLTAKKEDALFGSFNVGGGFAEIRYTYNNYWNPREPPHTWQIDGWIELWDDPNSYERAVRRLREGKDVVYVYERHFFTDEYGQLATESCNYYQGPDFSVRHECFGHNGPFKSKKWLSLRNLFGEGSSLFMRK